ncbi:Retrovirus-related Pol polyprotein from transposon RE1 [Sesamum angolense]|uniref:Retrovirus-related Pol polyprotein from transposon RE1 n=1 Tax=Sesamum angolense TaxID=2727404 RepID=A0AAE1WBC9_9LAMI|nr:Retrovirus-related Pol polyprotein from transposon RE1 [Sesamum angolense]
MPNTSTDMKGVFGDTTSPAFFEAVRQELLKLMKGKMVQDSLQVNFAHTTDDFIGATSHMCARLNVLSNPRSPSHKTMVHLPDGSSQPVESLGDVTLHDHLTITNVLYVPRFAYNLLSVQKLCQDSHVSFIFLSSHCLIQDLKISKIIGVGRQLECLRAHRLFLANVAVVQEPRSFAQASQNDDKRKAMQLELHAPEQNDTWDLTILPEGKKSIGSRWCKYLHVILDDCKMLDARSVSTPLPPGIQFDSASGVVLSSPDRYRCLIGRLLYLGFSKPDVSFAVQQLSQFLQHP